jgi:hypothetical protein
MYVVSTIAGGKGEGHLDGIKEKAMFGSLQGICIDKKKNIYIADSANRCIRSITPDGRVSTLVGRPGKHGKTISSK